MGRGLLQGSLKVFRIYQILFFVLTMPQPTIAVIGAGHWGKNLIRNLYELGALHTICTRDKAALHELLKHYQGVVGAVSINHVVRNEDITAVCIATPAHTHCELAQTAIEAGKDVFVEKPLCLSVEDGQKLVELAQRNDRILMVGHQLWYHPAVIKLQKMISNGELGNLIYISSSRLSFGRFRHHENVLWSFAPHDISTILGLVGEMPVSIQAHGGGHTHSSDIDTATLLLDFPGGAKAHIHVSRMHPGKEQRLTVTGEKQTVIFDDMAPWPMKLAGYPYTVNNAGVTINGDLQQPYPIPLESCEPLKAECEHFLHCIKTRSRPKTDGTEALRVIRVLMPAWANIDKMSGCSTWRR
jgi:UDP-2-acetamido-3-amino-2,3-dideoxy-glucuronate N-acetyltransferase